MVKGEKMDKNSFNPKREKVEIIEEFQPEQPTLHGCKMCGCMYSQEECPQCKIKKNEVEKNKKIRSLADAPSYESKEEEPEDIYDENEPFISPRSSNPKSQLLQKELQSRRMQGNQASIVKCDKCKKYYVQTSYQGIHGLCPCIPHPWDNMLRRFRKMGYC